MTDTSREAMQTIGFVGMGRIGLPICEHMIKRGYRVLGYRRSESADFERLGGIRARSPAEIGTHADIIFTCLPTASYSRRARARSLWNSDRMPWM